VLNGVVRPGDVVAVVGAGPIGLAAIMGARLFSPSHIVAIDLVDTRLESAKLFGADVVVNNSTQDAATIIAELTGGLGADVTIEAVGIPETFEQAVSLARPGGHIANIGVHGKAVTLHLEELWSRDVTITTGLVGTSTIPTLLRLLRSAQLDATQFVTHRFTLDEMMEAHGLARWQGFVQLTAGGAGVWVSILVAGARTALTTPGWPRSRAVREDT
jgi:alcohol dehydrogenase